MGLLAIVADMSVAIFMSPSRAEPPNESFGRVWDENESVDFSGNVRYRRGIEADGGMNLNSDLRSIVTRLHRQIPML